LVALAQSRCLRRSHDLIIPIPGRGIVGVWKF
jgi:hypothetical protein